jgi:peptidoglycan/LPS O-acetylase OafA/YrhL
VDIIDNVTKQTAQPLVGIQGLRALAAICVMTRHWNDFTYGWLLPQNQIDVDVFFAAEGFIAASVLGLGQAGARFWPALGRHLLKVYPVYLIGLLAGVILAMPFGVPLPLAGPQPWSRPIMEQAALLNAALLPTFLGPGTGVFSFNLASWAIVIEIYAYVLMIALRRWLSLSVLIAIVAAGALGYLSSYVLLHDVNLGYMTTHYWAAYPRVIFGFFGGALLYSVIQRFGPILPRLNPLVPWAAFIAVQFVQYHKLPVPLVFIGVPAIVWLSAVSTDPKGLRAVARQGGVLAYGIYLLCIPTVTAFHAAADHYGVPKSVLHGPLSYLLQSAVVILFAYIARRFVEEPLRGGVDEYLAGKAAVEEAA